MKIISSILISLSVLAPSPAFRTVALVAHAISAASASGSTTSSINTTGANFCVVSTFYYSISEPTVSDSKGNTWTPRTAYDTGFQTGVQIFYTANPTVGSGHTFTVSGGASYSGIAVGCFSGVKLTSPYDSESGATSVGTTLQPGSITPSENNELIFSACSFGNTIDACNVSGSSFSALDNQVPIPGDGIGGASGYVIQGTSGSSNPTWTQSSAQYIAVNQAAFKMDSGGGGATVPAGIFNGAPIKCCKDILTRTFDFLFKGY